MTRLFIAMSKDRWDDSMKKMRLIAKRADAKGDIYLAAQAHRALGVGYLVQHDLLRSKQQFDKALDIFEELHDEAGIGDVHRRLATWARASGKGDESDAYLDLAEKDFARTGDRSQALLVADDRLFRMLQTRTDDTDAELAAIANLLPEAEALGMKAESAVLLQRRGDMLYNKGDYSAAEADFDKASLILRKMGLGRVLSNVLISKARIARAHGRISEARVMYRESLDLMRNAHDMIGPIYAINALAGSYLQEKNIPMALRYYHQALALAERNGGKTELLLLHGNLAVAYMENGQYARARPLLKRSTEEEVSPYYIAERYRSLAKCDHKLGDDLAALEESNRAIDFGSKDNKQEFLALALSERARVYEALGQKANALSDSQKALEILETIRTRLVENDILKQRFSDTVEDVYQTAIDLRFNAQDFKGAAEVAEQARGRAFLDLMATRQLGNRPPARFSSTESAHAATADEMLTAAKATHSTLLSYWVSQEGVLIFVTTPDGVLEGMKVKVERKALQKMVASSQIANGMLAGTAMRSAGRGVWGQLYDVLIKPIRAYLPSERGALLTVIPHGPLFGVSFAALRDARGHYLVEQFALHYVPAAAMLNFTAENETRAKATPPRYVLVANSLPTEGLRLGRLTAAASEIEDIVKTAGADNTEVIQDDHAQVGTVTKAMQAARVIHIAAHAVLNNAEPLASFIVLAPDQNSGALHSARGKLSATDIYDLRIPASLVVLSACDTARGQIGGDGVVSLSRAFFSAGAASVVASLWEIPDSTTGFAMREFYLETVHKGQSKASALRTAQLKLIHSLRNGELTVKSAIGSLKLQDDPHLWAGFVLEGNP